MAVVPGPAFSVWRAGRFGLGTALTQDIGDEWLRCQYKHANRTVSAGIAGENQASATRTPRAACAARRRPA